MSELFKVLANGLKPKPVPPTTSQTLSCPAGYTGSGEHQVRSATWNVATQSWDVSGWSTVSYDCQIDQFTFVGPDTVELANTGIYDHTLTANGHTARIRAAFYGRKEGEGIAYEVWAPTLAGRLCRPHWKAEPPSYKGPESNWQDFQPLSETGYLFILPRLEQEYGTGPYHNLKSGEVNGCNIDIK